MFGFVVYFVLVVAFVGLFCLLFRLFVIVEFSWGFGCGLILWWTCRWVRVVLGCFCMYLLFGVFTCLLFVVF